MTNKSQLDPIVETMLIPLYFRSAEGQRPDGLLNDPRAGKVLAQVDFDFSYLRKQVMTQTFVVTRARHFDHSVERFIVQAPPNPVVVEIGCGLDARYERLGNPPVRWFNLDVPEAIRLRKQYIGDMPGCTDLSGSAFELEWLEKLPKVEENSIFFLAEGVFPYFREEEVKVLILAVRERYPGCEIIFDAVPPVEAWLSGLHPVLRGREARVSWGMKDDHTPEAWGKGIRLLERWCYFTDPEPRLRPYRWMGWIPAFGLYWRVVRYLLGNVNP